MVVVADSQEHRLIALLHELFHDGPGRLDDIHPFIGGLAQFHQGQTDGVAFGGRIPDDGALFLQGRGNAVNRAFADVQSRRDVTDAQPVSGSGNGGENVKGFFDDGGLVAFGHETLFFSSFQFDSAKMT